MYTQQNANSAQSENWFVQVNGQVYGPYTPAQMQGFVSEGRVNNQSILSQNPAQGYAQAAQFQSFLQWSGQLAYLHQPQTQQTQPLQNQAQQNQAQQNQTQRNQTQQGQGQQQTGAVTPQHHAAHNMTSNPVGTQLAQAAAALRPSNQPIQVQASHAGATANVKTVFVVMAEIRSGNGMQFLQALQSDCLDLTPYIIAKAMSLLIAWSIPIWIFRIGGAFFEGGLTIDFCLQQLLITVTISGALAFLYCLFDVLFRINDDQRA